MRVGEGSEFDQGVQGDGKRAPVDVPGLGADLAAGEEDCGLIGDGGGRALNAAEVHTGSVVGLCSCVFCGRPLFLGDDAGGEGARIAEQREPRSAQVDGFWEFRARVEETIVYLGAQLTRKLEERRRSGRYGFGGRKQIGWICV